MKNSGIRLRSSEFEKGMSILELIIYCGLLSVVLSLLYVFFIQVSYQRAVQVIETEIYSNGYRMLFDFEQTIRNASSLQSPGIGSSANSLSLDSGNVVYRVNSGQALEKVENGIADKLTDNRVVVDQIVFESLGPSTQSSTIRIKFSLKGNYDFRGKEKREDFQTAISLR